MALEITDGNIEEVLNTEKPVLIDFWAAWCGPCRMVAPTIESLHTDYGDKAVIGKVDVDVNPETASKYGIRNIPTLLFIQNGEVVDKVVGVVPKDQLAQKLDALM
ncbi:MAG: thioredoxin [Weeksellaceae bacterium]|nr:thioredoxin [Weeksellaceae bacterium]